MLDAIEYLDELKKVNNQLANLMNQYEQLNNSNCDEDLYNTDKFLDYIARVNRNLSSLKNYRETKKAVYGFYFQEYDVIYKVLMTSCDDLISKIHNTDKKHFERNANA